jgi:hypothetical protein
MQVLFETLICMLQIILNKTHGKAVRLWAVQYEQWSLTLQQQTDTYFNQ